MKSENQITFGEAAQLVKIKTTPSETKEKKYIGLEHIEQNTLRLSGFGEIDSVTSEKFLFQKGDILFGRLRPYFRKVVIAPFSGICSTDIWVIKANKNVDQLFLYYWISSSDFISNSAKSAKGTRMPRADWNYLSRLKLPTFSLKQQSKIGSLLKKIDNKIEINHRICETLEKIASAIFKSWFVDFDPVKAKMKNEKLGNIPQKLLDLFPESLIQSSLGVIPKDWNIDTIGKIAEVFGGGTPDTKNMLFWNGGHSWATPKDLSSLTCSVLLSTERKLTDEGLRRVSCGLLPKNTILLSSRAPIGYICLSEIPVSVNQGIIGLDPKFFGKHFLYNLIQSNLQKIKKYANGSVFQEISKKSFNLIKIYFPNNRCLLEKFEEIADALHKKKVAVIKQNETLIQIRDNLIPKLLSGEVKIE